MPPRISAPPADRKGASRPIVVQPQAKTRAINPQPRPASSSATGKKVTNNSTAITPRRIEKNVNPQPRKGTLSKKHSSAQTPANLQKIAPSGPLNPPPSPASAATAKPLKNTAPESIKPERTRAKPQAPAPTAKTPPSIKTPPLPIVSPPAIIAGELISLKPGKTTKNLPNRENIAASRTEKPQKMPPPPQPPSSTVEVKKGSATPQRSLPEQAVQLAESLTKGKNTLGLSVEDVLDLTKAEDNLPFIKHEPPSTSAGGTNDLVISAIKQTDFDIGSSKMEFSGDVQIKSPRFAMRCDRFIVHLKKDGSGISYGEGLGNVFIRMRTEGKPSGHEGFARRAIYLPEEGKLTLSGWPKIREQQKEHVAATEETKMVLYTDGRVKTLGRNRTIISN
jgi:lipopolysaccharide export system protein LptA